ncbi:hypothetical protein EUGRSUZ_K03355 [Eucalyptus grandis]|uniref:Uncharacterized protein n=2 Tax=Eucalyptus grandis TaxID=71139 RepID=A0ACC3J0P9_EUCGR|nr:hypothetical protein EUGRSUZ_K03355 [Eucalyptus grandis]
MLIELFQAESSPGFCLEGAGDGEPSIPISFFKSLMLCSSSSIRLPISSSASWSKKTTDCDISFKLIHGRRLSNAFKSMHKKSILLVRGKNDGKNRKESGTSFHYAIPKRSHIPVDS